MGFFDSIVGGGLTGSILAGGAGALTGVGLSKYVRATGRKAVNSAENQVGKGGLVDKAGLLISPGGYLATSAGIGYLKGRRDGTGTLGSVAGTVAGVGSSITGKAGVSSLPPVVDPAIDQQALSDNAAAYRAARRRQMLAGQAAGGTSLTGPGGLGDSSGGAAKTLLGA